MAEASAVAGAELRGRVRAATGELLTGVLSQADLPAAAVQAVVARLTPAGRPVTVERLALLLDQLGFALQLAAVPRAQLNGSDNGGGS